MAGPTRTFIGEYTVATAMQITISSVDMTAYDVVIAIISQQAAAGGAFAESNAGGWVLPGASWTDGSFHSSTMAYKINPGLETLVFARAGAGTAANWKVQLFGFVGADSCVVAGRASSTADALSLDIGTGVDKDISWLSAGISRTTTAFTAGPAGYSNFTTSAATTPQIATATLDVAGDQAEDPGAYTGGGTGKTTGIAAIWQNAPPPVAVTPVDAAEAHTVSEPTLLPAVPTAAANATEAHTAGQPTLTANVASAVASATSAHTGASPSLMAIGATTPAAAAHAHSASQPLFSNPTAGTAPANASNAHSVTQPTLAATAAGAPASSILAQTASQPAIAGKTSTAATSALHAHHADQPALGARVPVAAASASHGTAATQPAFSNLRAVLAPASALSAQSATIPALIAHVATLVASATHAQAASLAVTEFWNLAIARGENLVWAEPPGERII